MNQEINAKDWHIKIYVPTAGFPPVKTMPLPYENFFELLPLIKAGKNEGLCLKMKHSPTEKWPLSHPLKNEGLFQDMIPGKKSSNCKLAFHICVSLVKQHWEIKG